MEEVLLDFGQHCQNINKNLTDLIEVCYYAWPYFYQYRQQEIDKQNHLNNILTKDLPRLLPGYTPEPVTIKPLPVLPTENPSLKLSEMQRKHFDKLYNMKDKDRNLHAFLEELYSNFGKIHQTTQAPNSGRHVRSTLESTTPIPNLRMTAPTPPETTPEPTVTIPPQTLFERQLADFRHQHKDVEQHNLTKALMEEEFTILLRSMPKHVYSTSHVEPGGLWHYLTLIFQNLDLIPDTDQVLLEKENEFIHFLPPIEFANSTSSDEYLLS